MFQLSILLRRDRPQARTYGQSWDTTNIPDVRHDSAITDRLPMRRRYALVVRGILCSFETE